MINIDFTNIDNSKLVGMLLPFWARGRKLSMLIQALIYPLKYAHTNFRNWAFETYVEHHITGQKMSLEWFLKHRLKKHFLSPSDSFFITQSIDELKQYLSYGLWNNEENWNNYVNWDNGFNGEIPDIDTSLNGNTLVYAPRIVETVSYDYADYERDIRFIMSKYMINFSKIHIIFASL